MEPDTEKMEPDKEETGRKKRRMWDIRPYLAIGATAVLVILICIIMFFVFLRFGELMAGIRALGRILQAILIGVVVAYVLNPVMMFFERRLQQAFRKRITDEKKIRKLSRSIAIAGAELVFLGIIVALLSMIIPQLIISVEQLAMTLPDQIQNLMDRIQAFSRGTGPQAGIVRELITNGTDYLEEWIRTEFLGQAKELMTYVTSGVVGVVKTIFNIIVGIIVSVYILVKKETFISQLKKLVYTIFPPRAGNRVMEVLRKSDDIFGGFFIGEIIDAIIIGLLCFGVLYIGRFPYALLVSVIVGVTNIIPFFGPFLGAIPGALLICLESPIHALYFLIIILIIQQLDGNVIKPKVLGDTTGLSPFWVIFAILLFGGLFGFLGMLFGVPVFAIIYYLIKRIAEHFLRKRNMPEKTMDYLDFAYMDTGNGKPVFYEEDRQERHQKRSEQTGGTLKKLFVKWKQKKKDKKE